MRRMYAKHRHAWIYRSIRACHAEALAKAGPLACLVGKTFPRFGCIALRAYLFSATDAGSFKSATGRIRRGEPGATPQGNVAREDQRCSDLSFEVDAARECRARRLESVVFDTLAKLTAAAMATWANCGRD